MEPILGARHFPVYEENDDGTMGEEKVLFGIRIFGCYLGVG